LVVAVPALQLGWSAAWGLAVLGLLALGPHVSGTEDLVLCCALATLDDRRVPPAVVAAATWRSAASCFRHCSDRSGTRPSLLFFAKLAVAGIVVGTARAGRSAPA
jgi:hypothetical protein